MTQGWILLHREILESSLWRKHPKYLTVFLYLLLMANHKDKKVKLHNGEEIIIKRGQFLTSYDIIAESCKWNENRKTVKLTPKETRYILDGLAKSQTVAGIGAGGGLLITIINYEKYQNKTLNGADIGAVTRAGLGQDKGRTRAPNNNDNNDNNDKEVIKDIHSQIISYWNEHSNKKSVRGISKTRKLKLNSRFKEPVFTDGWKLAIDNISKSQFCLDGNWCTFDWFIKNDSNYVKALEGNYDNSIKVQGNRPESDRNYKVTKKSAV